MKINEVIKRLRKNNQLTQEQLAEQLSVSRSAISSWETGRTYPDLDTVVLLSDIFEVSLDDLLKGDRDIVTKITKDTRVRKRNRFWIAGLTTILLLILATGIYKFNQFVPVTPNDIVATQTHQHRLSVKLKPKAFYRYGGYVADTAGNGTSDGGAYHCLVVTKLKR